MLASGLPVVSTLMRPLVDLTEGLVVVDNASDFRERVGTLCRGALSQQAQAHMAALCRANDYDNKFRQVLGSLVEIVEPDAAPASHHDPFMAELSRHLARVEEVQAVYGKDRENLVAEIRRLQTVYEELTQRYYQEVTRLQAVYGADRQNLVAEIQQAQTAYEEQTQHHRQEVQRLQMAYEEQTRRYSHEVQRLEGIYGEEVQQRNIEIQRLHTVYGDEVRQRNAEIQRLHAVYSEAIQQRDAEIQQLHTVGDTIRRFGRILGSGALSRSLTVLRRAARHPKEVCRKAAGLLLFGKSVIRRLRERPKTMRSRQH
jgi:hypothetical protein